jgi:hypothetical protein
VDNFQRNSGMFRNSFGENLIQPPLFKVEIMCVGSDFVCEKVKKKCQVFNKLGVRLQHVDFLWSLQIFFTYLTKCHWYNLAEFLKSLKNLHVNIWVLTNPLNSLNVVYTKKS